MKKKKHALRKLIISFYLALLSIGLLNAATYYVGPSGSNGNDGLTPSSAFNTIQYAVEYVASHGGPENNNVILLEGGWPQTVTINDVPACANWTSNLLIQGVNTNVRLYSVKIYCKRLTIKGIKITSIQNLRPGDYSRLEDITGVGLTWWNITASNITWLRCKATDDFSVDADVVRIAADNNDPANVPTNILFQDCCFRGSSISPGNHIDVIQTLGVVNFTLKNCKIWHAPTGLVMTTYTNGVPIKGLLFEDCYFGEGTFYAGGSLIQDLTVKNCKITGGIYYRAASGIDSWTGNEINGWYGQAGGYSPPFPTTFENNIVKTSVYALPPNNTLNPNLVITVPNCAADEPDLQAPSVPTGLSAGAISGSTVALSWNTSTDNRGVVGYKVYTNGANPINVTGTSTTLTGLNPTTQYSLTVSAYDASSNESSQSSALNVTTTELDTQAPSAPTGLSTGTITTSSVALSWNASTDNVGVTNYNVYINGANPVNVTGTSATINNLADNTQYSFTVSALDMESNESAQSSSVSATTVELTGVISSTAWQSFTESTQTGSFTATFDAIPSAGDIDAVTGIQNGAASAYGELACIIRFNSSGQIDARNGAAYAATNTVNYTAGISYHFRVEIDVPSHLYSVYVTPQGGSEQTAASNFAFRSEQASVSQLTGWSVYAYSGSHAVDNMTFSSGSVDTEAPSIPTGLTAGAITSNSVDLSWTVSTDNVGVTGYKVYTNGANPQTVAGASATINGLSASTQYSFTVSAYDAAGNESAQSPAINATTQAGSSLTGYFVDPATGSMSNDGSEASPWSTLADVFAAGKTFQPGDVIYLKNGNHGWPNITQSNSGIVTIKSYPGNNPVINRLDFNNAVNWKIEGVRIYVSTAPPAAPVLTHPVYGVFDNYLVRLTACSYITFDNCYVYSTENSSAWTADDWNYKAWCGIYLYNNSQHITIRNSVLKNLNFAIDMAYSSGHTISHNTIQNFCGDGMRVSSNCIIEYNEILDGYQTNGNHVDGMQAFASSGAIIRGNKVISATSNRSFIPYAMQGIGFFDGFFDNYTIENNLVVVHTWHGISLYGARNCKIVNNTVVENLIGTNPYGPPWIAVFNHKDGTASSGNIMRNNLTSDVNSTAGTSVSNNIETTSYTSHFVNYAGLDFRLQPTSSAVDGGTISSAPTIDLNQYPRSGNPDVGCYELGTTAPTNDSIAPSVPTGLTVGTITASSVALNWSASTDDTGVAGYKIYTNGTNPVISSGTSTIVSNLSGSTTYTFTVSAYDAAGNESAQSSLVNATTLEQTGITSNSTFQSFTLSTQTGTFTAEFDAIPNGSNIDAVTGIQNGTASGYGDIACIIRFNSSGQIDARNGDSYSATNAVNYTGGINYHFRIEVDVPAHTYSVYITPQGGSEQTVATDFAFRTEQASVSQLTGWSLYAYAGSHSVDNMTFTSAGGDTQAPSVPTNLAAGTITETSVDLSWSASTDNVGVTGYKVYTDGSNPVTVTGTSTTINGLTQDTQYSFTVSAIDAASNESPQSTAVNATTLAPQGITSTSEWQSFDVSTQTGTFTAEFDVVPNAQGLDNVTGIQNGVADFWDDLACVVRFNTSNTIDARNGGSYAAATSVSYTSGTLYHVRLEIDIPSHTYSIYVTPQGQSEITLGTNYAFRTEQQSVTQLTGWSLQALSGSHTVSNMSFSVDEGDTEAPSVPTGLSAGTITGTSVALSWNASTDNVGVTGYKVYTNGSNPVTVGGTSTTINGLSQATQYSFTVSAIDDAGNESAQSAAVQATTLDTQAPSVPTGLSAGTITETSVALSWNASTDNVGVTGYKVYTNGSNPVTVGGTSTTINGLSQATQCSFTVSAIDGAGNESSQSAAEVVTTQAESDPLIANMVGYWAFDQINGSVTPDGSGNGNDGTVSGATLTTGQIDDALNFDGSNDKVSLGNLDVTPSSGNDGISLAAWINPNVWTEYYDNRIISKSTGTTEQDHYWMLSGVNSNNKAVLRLRLKTGTVTTTLVADASGEIPVNQWSHVAATYDGSTMKIYLNGNLVGSVAKTGTVATNSNVEATIGVNPDGARPFDGEIDEVYIFDRGLSAQEITDLMTRTSSGSSDTEAPSVPTGLTAGTITETSVTLSWNASIDNVGVTGYKVYTDGSNPVNVTGTSTTINGLSASTQYSFTVSAVDAASNESAQSAAIQATTATPPDTEAPSVPTGLVAGTVTSSSVALSWTASTDNVVVTGYKVYTNSSNPVTVTGTSTTINGLSASTQYSFTVSAVDAAGNESAQSSSVSVTTQQAPSGITSSATWQSFGVSTETGVFTATFDAVPDGNNIDALTGILNGSASGYGDIACIIRFYTNGQIDARNGGSYEATNVVNYTSGISYHFRVEISVPTHTYSVYVTPQGGSEQTVASNFAFRSEQSSVSQLTGWTLYASSGSHTVSAMAFTPAPPDTEAPSVPTGLASGSIYSTGFTLSWTASTDNVGVAIYEVFKDGSSIGTTNSTSMSVTGLSPETTYSMTVRAGDAVPNWSAQSSALNITTPASSSGDWPNASNTGPSGTLTASGPITVTTNGAIIQNLNISGSVTIQANNVTIRNCVFGALQCNSSSYTGTVVEDCILSWAGSLNFTLRRCEMSSQSDDLIRISGGNVLIEDCYLHIDGPVIEGTHVDIIQSYPTPTYNSVIRHNTLYNKLNQTGCVNADDVTIDNNLIAGGSFSIYGSNPTVINNHFSTIFFPSGGYWGIYYYNNTAAEWSGNVWHETGAPALYPNTSSAKVEEDIVLKETSKSQGITLYPNPLNGNTLNIQLNGFNTNDVNVVIYDIIGKTVYNQSHSMVEQTGLQIPVENLSKGIYIISVNGNQQKLVVE